MTMPLQWEPWPELGIPGADQPVDARTLPANADGTVTAEFADIVEKRRVFGRVTAEHKRNMVRSAGADIMWQ